MALLHNMTARSRSTPLASGPTGALARPLGWFTHTVAASLALTFLGLIAAPGCETTTSTPSQQLSRTAVVGGLPLEAESIPMGETATIERIIAEGRERNQVMDHLTYLSEHIGPRLTGSSRAEAANRWAADQFRSWGLSNVHQHQWGTIPVRFDRGPTAGKVLAPERKRGEDGERSTEMKSVRELQLSTLAWTSGTDGPKRGPIVRMPDNREAYEAMKDRLDGAWVLIAPPSPTGRTGIRGVGQLAGERYRQRRDARKAIAAGEAINDDAPVERLVLGHNVLGFITSSRDERVWTTSCPGWRELDFNQIPPDVEVMVRLSDYDYLNSRLTDGEPIEVEIDAQHTLIAGPVPVYNTIAEIRGTTRPDEVVIISGHLDSWDGPGSQGTTDNGTGSSVTLETARLLMAAGARPDRTIRFVLWTGEEQGLLGSRGYVESLTAAELDRISAVFVDDGGTNSQGGLNCVPDMLPMLAAATAPVNGLFVDDVTGEPLRVDLKVDDKFEQTGGSDHASFIAVGVPGFFWREVGRAEYGYGWHTQNDRLNLAVERYLSQSSVCSAITAYNLACAPTMLPRFESSSANRFVQPERVSASDGAFHDYVLVSWRTVRSADRYNIFRSGDDNWDNAELVGNGVKETPFEDRTAEPGRRYWYWVDARRGESENSGHSQEAEPGFHGALPALDKIQASQDVCGGVRLTWSVFDGVDRVQIFAGRRADTGQPGNGSDQDTPDTASGPIAELPGDQEDFLDSRDLNDTQARSYWLRGVNARGPGAWTRTEGRTRACE